MIKFYRGLKDSYSIAAHGSDIYFATDTLEILHGGNSYSGLNKGAEIVSSVDDLDPNAPQGSLAVFAGDVEISHRVSIKESYIGNENPRIITELNVHEPTGEVVEEPEGFVPLFIPKGYTPEQALSENRFIALYALPDVLGCEFANGDDGGNGELWSTDVGVSKDNVKIVNDLIDTFGGVVYAGNLYTESMSFLVPTEQSISSLDAFLSYDEVQIINETTLYIKEADGWEEFKTGSAVVNNLEEGGIDKALSAEMGKFLNEKISNVVSGTTTDPIKFKGYVNVDSTADIDRLFELMEVGESYLVVPATTKLDVEALQDDSYVPWIASGMYGEPFPLSEDLLKMTGLEASNITKILSGKGEVRTYFKLDKDNPYWTCPDMLLLAKLKVNVKQFAVLVPELADIYPLIPASLEMTACIGKILRWSAGDWLLKNMDNFAAALTHHYEPYNTSPADAWETGIIAYTLQGGPIGNERFTVIVNASSDTDASGNATVQQIAYGRTGVTEGRVWTRVGFSQVGWQPWVEISNNKNILPNVNGWLLNSSEQLVTGVYQTCNTRYTHYTTVVNSEGKELIVEEWRSIGELTNTYCTLFVNASTSPNGDGYDAVEQTAYGREADSGKIYRRMIFYHKTNNIKQYGEWVDISFSNRPSIIFDYDTDSGQCVYHSTTTFTENVKSLVGKSLIWSNNHKRNYYAPTIKTNDGFITIGKDGFYSTGLNGGSFTKIPFEIESSGGSSDVQKFSAYGDLDIATNTLSLLDDIENLTPVGFVIICSSNDDTIAEVALSLINGNEIIIKTTDYCYVFIKNEDGEWVLVDKRSNYSERLAAISDKQDILISGDNIKTINNQSILGSGNITIQGGEIPEVIDKEIYYNDGSNEVVPVKWPDLSTNPSILPYKFMGQYVYEQLIPVKVGDRMVNCNFEVEYPMILSAGVFGMGVFGANSFNPFKNVDIIATKSDALLLDSESELGGYINVKYTDGSQLLHSNGYGYGYEDNSTESFALLDFELSPDGKTVYIYNPNTEVLSLYKSGEITSKSIPQNIPAKNIILGDGVKSIGTDAFADCSLKSITIPESVTSIGNYAFDDCTTLTSVNIPENSQLTSIGNRSFSSCSSLTSITIPANVWSIGEYAFDNCSSLTSVTIPENSRLKSIGSRAFSACRNLERITIPESVTKIGSSAFYNCLNLTTINIPEDSKLTSIGYSAFQYCNRLSSIDIPKGVTSIGDYAFNNCTSLTGISCKAIVPPVINSTTFGYVDKSIPLYVPAGTGDAYKAAEGWNEFTDIRANM